MRAAQRPWADRRWDGLLPTEEEKLEPLKSVDGIPRLRLLNRLNAKRLKELQGRNLLEAAASGTAAPMSKEQQQVWEKILLGRGTPSLKRVHVVRPTRFAVPGRPLRGRVA